MRTQQWVILIIFAAAVGGMFLFQWSNANDSTGTADNAPPPKPFHVTQPGEFRGICMQMHGSDNPYEEYLREIAATGANTVCLTISAYQENCASTSIFIDTRKTPTDDRLRAMIDLAHKLGLKVAIMPIVLLENPRGGEWRGKIRPDNNNWDDWWQDYNSYILHVAKLAEQSKVELLLVGSELVSTEKQEDRWRFLIAKVRAVYSGRLSYSANWDHYRPIQWWDALDMVGMTTYYDLTGGDDPTVERLMQGWAPIKAKILEWQKTVKRPILFTEVGWPNQETAAQFPWDYYRAQNRPAPQVQANCFEAYFRTWGDCPAVAGTLVWEWRNNPWHKIGPKDSSYVPLGKKQTMAVIESYFHAANKAATQPTTQATTQSTTQPTVTARP